MPLADHLAKAYQLQATSSYLPGSQKSLTWAPEMIMLFWEVLQCNKRFRSFIVDTDRAHDFVVLILFHAIQNKNDPSKQGVVRMCVFVLQTLSVETTFGSRLNKQFHGQETLPQAIRIANFRGTYADFLIMVCRSRLKILSIEADMWTVNIHNHHREQGQNRRGLPCASCNHQ
jgi:hypothetical protein